MREQNFGSDPVILIVDDQSLCAGKALAGAAFGREFLRDRPRGVFGSRGERPRCETHQSSRPLKNYLRCRCVVKNRLKMLMYSSYTRVRAQSFFRLFLPSLGCLAYVFQRPANATGLDLVAVG